MTLLNSDQLKELVKPRTEPCISIFIPTHREWDKMSQDIIRFKNKLQEVKAKLKEKGYDEREINELLTESEDLLKNENFWQHQSNGLAMFISKNEIFYYRLPVEFDEKFYISDKFYVKPLLPLLSGDGRYFILALDLNESKLYHGSKYTVGEVELPKDTPTSLDEAMKLDDPEKSLQFHTGTGNRLGERSAVFHGQGVSKDEKKEKKNILRFFQWLDNGVMEKINQENAPLILIGVEYLIPIYREANSYSHIINKGIDKDPQNLSADEIHKLTWQKVEPLFKKNEEEALNKYGDLAQSNNTSAKLDKLINDSRHKRIDTLFIDLKEEKWGRFDEKNEQLILDPAPTAENEDLLEYIVVHTINNGGTIYTLPKDRMPNGEAVAAILRF